MPASDADLVSRIRQGDERALDELVIRYYAPLVTFVARIMESTDVAEDVVQELFIRLWRRRAEWEVRGAVRTYLFSAARNAARDAHAAQRARGRAESAAGSVRYEQARTEQPSLGEEVEDAELRELVARLTAELPERCREVYMLARDHGLSYGEIAQVLEISPSTVRTQMGRALAFLERRLAPLLAMLVLVRW